MTMLEAGILGAAIWGPGLEGWKRSRPVLAGEAPYEPRPSPPPLPATLPPAERRRSGPVVRLALAVAEEATAQSAVPPAALRGIFASSNGDGPVVGSILESLVTLDPRDRPVSPTQFHNSVHNATAGYWSIAHGSAQSATCMGLHDDSLAAALLTAMVEVTAEAAPVLLCAYDYPMPPPLDVKRPTLAPLGLGLVLAPPGRGTAIAQLTLRFEPLQRSVPPRPRAAGLRALAIGNAMGRGLRLLEALARREAEVHALPYLDGSLMLGLTP